MTLGDMFRLLEEAREKLLQPPSHARSLPRLGEGGLPSEAEDVWADAWVRKFSAAPKLGRLTARQRYVLALRFQSALDAYRIPAHFEPQEPVPSGAEFLERVLVKDWYRLHREWWQQLAQTPRPGQQSFST